MTDESSRSILLDTSAIVGWLERGNPQVQEWIRRHDEIPLCHRISVGELRAGIYALDAANDPDVSRRRQATLDVVLSHLEFVESMTPEQCRVFGIVDAHATRKVSHNDKWIIAAAIVGEHELVTEDQRQFATSTSLATGVFRNEIERAGFLPLRSRLIEGS